MASSPLSDITGDGPVSVETPFRKPFDAEPTLRLTDFGPAGTSRPWWVARQGNSESTRHSRRADTQRTQRLYCGFCVFPRRWFGNVGAQV